MHTFTFRVDQITSHLDRQTVLTLTELHTRVGGKFHPDPLHRMASIQISTFDLDLNQYQLGQLVELKMSIVTKIDQPVSPPYSEISPNTFTETKNLVNVKTPDVVEAGVCMMSASARRLAINNFGRHKHYPATKMRITRILHLLNECFERDEFCKVDLKWITTTLKISDVSTSSADIYDLRKWGILSWDGSDFKKTKVKFCIDWKSLLSPENQVDSRVPTEDDLPLHSDPVASNAMHQTRCIKRDA